MQSLLILLYTQLPAAACTETSTQALKGTVISPRPSRRRLPTFPSSPHAPPRLQARQPTSADPGWREPRIQLLFPRERNPPVWPQRAEPGSESRRGRPCSARSHFPPPQPQARQPGWGEQSHEGARGTAAGTICPSARGPARHGAVRGPRRCSPGADVGRAEWQEISQGLPPPRVLANRLRGRCSRDAHTHFPESTPPSNSLQPRDAALPAPSLRRACSGCGPGPWPLACGLLRAAP